ncbi:carbohydrate kinase family protein [Nocardioides sp. SYSU D00038]|uniref:carbohydrate kinase family protein n=1 Tax=Nocardioides sp. SYSU D00038 TaxID=2812554 RepID=UPI001966FF28|nr:carbohydrate kinase family protein [Nocardioides sp. SYSU D00038]
MNARVVVVGGANLDVLARTTDPLVAATSNPGTTVLTAGGVGRNIAENLARLGTPVALVAAVGTDVAGDQVVAASAATGVDVAGVRRVAAATGTYTAVLDHTGDLVAGVADMAATRAVTPEVVTAERDRLAAAELVVLDGNLAPATLARGLEVAAAVGTRAVVDPVSVPKARALVLDHPVHLVTPNADELAVLGGLEALHAGGATWVWVRRGGAGSELSGPGGTTRTTPPPPEVVGEVVDVTGGGDAMLAAWCHAVLAGASEAEAAAYGQVAAALTVASPHSVRPDLTDELVRSLL